MEHTVKGRSQQLLVGWAVREPRRSRRTRRQVLQSLSIASRRSKSLGKTQVHEEESMLNDKKLRKREQEVTKDPVKRIKIKDTENLKLKGPTLKPHTSSPLKKPTKQKEPVENKKARVGGNIESLPNKELQISARTETEAKMKKERKTELAVMKDEIKRIREEQERMNLELSARREEELKEIEKRKKELHILKNNIISLRKEQNKLMSMTITHIQGEGSKHISADTEVLEVSSAGQEVVTSGETHVQQVSSRDHHVLEKVVSSGENHVPEVVSTSLPALKEDTCVLPDLNNPFIGETS